MKEGALSWLSLLSFTAIGNTVAALPTSRAAPIVEAVWNQSLFQNRSQVDAVSVLVLLGEATVWKAIWGRFRSRRAHWRHWVFAISPGWTPLAASLFANMSGHLGPA